MNSGTTSNTNNSTSPKLSSFIEALKQRQQSRGPSSPDRPLPPSLLEAKQNKELEAKRIEQFHQARSKEWAAVYSAKQKQTENRIKEIREQLKKLIKQVADFEFNITQAVAVQPNQPGKYHISFLDHIKTIIQLLQKNIAEANSWLSLYNQRSKKKGHYWGKAKSQGASYTLSEERQLATSIG